MPSKQPASKNLTNIKQKLNKKHYIGFALVLIVAGAFVTSFFIRGDATSQIGKAEKVASLSITPASGKLSARNNFKFSIWEDSKNQPVNAVQANLTYDASKFSVVKIDGSTSPFTITAQAVGANGSIKIARGRIGSLTGKRLIAVVTLKPRVSSGSTALKIAPGTVVISSVENIDILLFKTGGNYTLVR